ncbi:MAG: hypothetical protein M1829_004090 [Trizodia sp. TS-e1964]|nr:MAG: hypothetical protein M1829_004090 [Trizodia sp. TS-e1964]
MAFSGLSLAELPKSNVFTSKLPPDPDFPTPLSNQQADRRSLGPRRVDGALFTYVRPDTPAESKLLSVSSKAMEDIGIQPGEEKTLEFQKLVAGKSILPWDAESGEGIYPWAQCYGGWQFGHWAGQLGDGRAISLFEVTNPFTGNRYELQLKGAGKTPYSRFADGRAVLRSSIREFIVSEALNALHIPSTRALSLTSLPKTIVNRGYDMHGPQNEPSAIVARFAQTWIRIGTFDLLLSRRQFSLIRQLATYVAEEVYGGWPSPPAFCGESEGENRFTKLFREIVHRNAKTVAAWQTYGFINGVLNTDNTSIYGLSLDFGPFAFLDNIDGNYTPNEDDHLLRYSYNNQPHVILWNLERLADSFGDLMGSGLRVDEDEIVVNGVPEDMVADTLKKRDEIIEKAHLEYWLVFSSEYRSLMAARLGLKPPEDFDVGPLFKELLTCLRDLELDFNHFFRRLSSVTLSSVFTDEARKKTAGVFFHQDGLTGVCTTEESARERMAAWLEQWYEQVAKKWGDGGDVDREKAMKEVNPKFLPRSWVLQEVIKRISAGEDTAFLDRIMNMTLNPFRDSWDAQYRDEEERYCGDVPKAQRGSQSSCSS